MAAFRVQPFVASSREAHLCLLVLYASMLVLSSVYITAEASLPTSSSTSIQILGRRSLEQRHVVQDSDDEVQPVKKSKSLGTTLSATRLIKPTTTTNNQTKPFMPVTSNSSKTNKDPSFQEKPNSTKPTSKTTILTKPTSKAANLTKPTSVLNQKAVDPTKKSKSTTKPLKKPTKSLGWTYLDDEEEDLVAGFRDLPSRIQETLLPDLEVLSVTSKAYLETANKEITNGFKPIVGKKYAAAVASMVSCAFILIPLLLVSLILNQIKAYFSLQKLVIFIQIYLSIYFTVLCLTSLVTGLEPLKYFYAASQSTYICIQLLQTMAYVIFLLVLLMYFVLIFSTETGTGTKLLGLGQMFVGFAVGFHYYMTVSHRAVLHQPPKTSWKIHAIYATCFLLICLLGRAERRKKAYVMDGSEEGKMS